MKLKHCIGELIHRISIILPYMLSLVHIYFSTAHILFSCYNVHLGDGFAEQWGKYSGPSQDAFLNGRCIAKEKVHASDFESEDFPPIPRWSGNNNHKRGHITNPVSEHFIKPQNDLAFLWEELYWTLSPTFLDTTWTTHLLNLLGFIICITFYWPSISINLLFGQYIRNQLNMLSDWIYQRFTVVVLCRRGFLSGYVVLPFDKRVFVRIHLLDLCASEGQKFTEDSIKSQWKDKLANTLYFPKL